MEPNITTWIFVASFNIILQIIIMTIEKVWVKDVMNPAIDASPIYIYIYI